MEEATVMREASEYQIGDCKYRAESLLASGSFGYVRLAIRTTIQPDAQENSDILRERVALKVLNFRVSGEDIKSELALSMSRKLERTLQLSHENVVRVYQAGWLRNHSGNTLQPLVALEYCELGSLEKYLENKNGRTVLSEAAARSCSLDILKGLEFLHRKDNKLIHTDVKPDNVVLTRRNSPFRILAKLADIDNLVKIYNDTTGNAMPEMRGTMRFMAPEMLTCRSGEERSKAGRKTDIWSLGCTVIDIIRGDSPFYFTKLSSGRPMASEKENALMDGFNFYGYVGMDDGVPLFPKNCSQALRTFLGLCFDRVPDKRPSANDLLDHEWITTVLPVTPGDPWFV